MSMVIMDMDIWNALMTHTAHCAMLILHVWDAWQRMTGCNGESWLLNHIQSGRSPDFHETI